MKKIAGSIEYFDLNSQEIKQVTMDLLKDVWFKVDVHNGTEKGVTLAMEDKITSNVELGGSIGIDELEALIKHLSIICKQLKFEGR